MRYGRTARSAIPVKVLLGRISLLFLISLAAALMILNRANNAAVTSFRNAVADVVAPVLDVLSRPIDAVHASADWAGNVFALYDQNKSLRAENQRLRQWETVARQLEQENQRFRELLGVRMERGVPFVTTRIVGDSGGSFVRAALLSAGARDGVQNGQAVVEAEGLVGHVVSVGRRSARALLLTDLNSRIPVALDRGGYRAILVGDNSAMPRLEFIPVGTRAVSGERIVTSGDGGLLPPGIPVGQVVLDEDGAARVKLFADSDRVEFVRVVAYRLPPVAGAVENSTTEQARPQ